MRLVPSAVASALVALCLVGASPAQAQVTVYADFTAAKLTNLTNTYVLYGPTIGLTATLVPLSHFDIGADLRGSFLGGSRRLDGLAVGPRFSTSIKGIKPYAEVLAGFARYNNGLGASSSGSSDGQFDIILGVDKHIRRHIDWRVLEYAYEQYYGLGGQFNPKNFSTGLVYHFNK